MARRTLAPLMPKESTGEAPLLMIEAAEKGAAHSSLAPPNPNPREEVAPPRVTHDAPAPMAGSSPVHRDRAPHMESSAAAPNIFIGKVPLRTYPMLPQPETKFARDLSIQLDDHFGLFPRRSRMGKLLFARRLRW
ncbi:UNVERIFIED_CONTAM: hypothetical protein Slati_0893700 [Sesamum latifolium]|uniref:Uncharacterized protein n=1 Tax=Sesamum latifolium TaxID=2727402 RepID=A0AAW2XNB8_9LAMI